MICMLHSTVRAVPRRRRWRACAELSARGLSGLPPAADKADMWSCGVTLYCMLTGAYPFAAPDNKIRCVPRRLRCRQPTGSTQTLQLGSTPGPGSDTARWIACRPRCPSRARARLPTMQGLPAT